MDSFKRSYKILYKTTCLFAGGCMNVQQVGGKTGKMEGGMELTPHSLARSLAQLFAIGLIQEWLEERMSISQVQEYLGLDNESTMLYHILIISACMINDQLSPYSSVWARNLKQFTLLAPVKHSIPFFMGLSCFVAALRSVSLSGAGVLITALVLLISSNKVKDRLWRATGLMSMLFAATSFVFQFPWLDKLATAGAFWYGLKRPETKVADP